MVRTFPGDSQMARRMRETDWSATPLGDPSTWPTGLTTPLAMMLTSRFEMWLGWGEDLRFFYNDAYIPTLGVKHPGALGQPFKTVWREVYADVEAQVRSVMVEGRPTWNKALRLLLERSGYPEETYHTFSYSPLRDGQAIRGLMCIVTEETERVISERRLETMRQLGEHLIGADTEESVVQAVCDTLAANTTDFPFALMWTPSALGGFEGRAASADAAGLLDLDWPLEASAGGPFEQALSPQIGYPTGAWARGPNRALIAPVQAPFGPPAAVLVLGLNPHRPADPGLTDLALLIADRAAGAFARVQGREAERRRFDRFWSNARDLMVVVDSDGVFRSVSPGWTRILGHPVEEVVGRPSRDFLVEEEIERTAKLVGDVKEGGQATGFENRYRTKDGGFRWISWNTAYEGGLIYGYGRDITEEKQQAQQLRKAEDALHHAQKMEAIGQLTGGVAHDFNNLLTVIRSSADLLRRPNLPPERRERYVDAISDTADRAAKLTGQLLAFSRRQALKPERFNVTDRVVALDDMLRSMLGARVRFEIQSQCDDCVVEADASQFETALINLIVNGRDAMTSEGRLIVRIEAVDRLPPIRGHAAADGEFISVAVVDEGAGIDQDNLEKVFEPFFTTKDVGRGTGLGLSQVYGFAKQSGGDVSVDSALGLGSTFTLYLPRTRAAMALAPETRESPDARHDGRVLVVEDNAAVGEFATELLRDLGYHTELAVNAEQALQRLDEGAFDLVFSDVVMPGLGGVELAQIISERWPGTPVVLTSGYSHGLASKTAHPFPLLKKPYSVEELSRALNRIALSGGLDRTESSTF